MTRTLPILLVLGCAAPVPDVQGHWMDSRVLASGQEAESISCSETEHDLVLSDNGQYTWTTQTQFFAEPPCEPLEFLVTSVEEGSWDLLGEGRETDWILAFRIDGYTEQVDDGDVESVAAVSERTEDIATGTDEIGRFLVLYSFGIMREQR